MGATACRFTDGCRNRILSFINNMSDTTIARTVSLRAQDTAHGTYVTEMRWL